MDCRVQIRESSLIVSWKITSSILEVRSPSVARNFEALGTRPGMELFYLLEGD
jgi:hypothetical protein